MNNEDRNDMTGEDNSVGMLSISKVDEAGVTALAVDDNDIESAVVNDELEGSKRSKEGHRVTFDKHVTMKKKKTNSWGSDATTDSNSSGGDGDEHRVEDPNKEVNDDDSSSSSDEEVSDTNIDIAAIEATKKNAPVPKSGSGQTRREHMFVVGVGILLSFNSGYVNGSCLSGLLTSNHISQSVAGFTGAYTISALALANGNYAIFGYQIKMILSFIFGSCISGFLTPNAVPYQIAPTYGPTFLIGGIFLTTASILSATHVEKYYFFYLAAAANGIQNGMSSLYSANLIRSTHLTGTSTDIGLFIGQYLRGNKKNLWKLRVLLSLAASFWLGGLISFYATSALTSWSLLFNAALFMCIGVCLIVFLVMEYHISYKAAVLGTWQWHNALEKLSTLSSRSQLTTSMMNVFDIVDSDKSGHIDRNELYTALKKSGVEVSMRDTDNMLKFADRDGDGVISREEWREVVSSCRTQSVRT